MLKILFIGQARGKTEAEYDYGFTGSSGIELSFMLSESGLGPNIDITCPNCNLLGTYPHCISCHTPLYPHPKDMINHWEKLKTNHNLEVTNVFEIHPEDNDLGHIFTPEKNDFMPGLKYDPKRPISYISPQYHPHVEKLWKRIQKTKPNLCILLGNVACWAILKETQIDQIRGTIQQSTHLGVKCLPTYNPANILKNWSSRVVSLSDFQKAIKESEFPEIRRTKRSAILSANLNEIESWLNQPANNYTIDIESGYALFTPPELKRMTPKMRYTLSSQISMVGFSRSPYDGIVIEFMTRNSKDLSYWPTKQEEIRAWELCEMGLQKPIPKIFQNGVYDLTRLLYAGITCNMAREDTMLLHHSLYPELKKGLGFLNSIYGTEGSWKQMYGQGESLKRDE